MLRTPFCDLLGIELPVTQAAIPPVATPELVAAVSNAGGLSSLAAIFQSADDLARQVARTRKLTDRPFAVNHVVPMLNEEAFVRTLALRPAVISFALGDPGDLVARAHDAGCRVIHQVHTVRQASQAAERGVDAIIAHGDEAGGMGGGVGAMILLPQVVDAVAPLPVLAAGGVGDGRGLAAALVLGAQGVNVGTRFVASTEAGAGAAWNAAIVAAASEDAVRATFWPAICPPPPGGYDVAPRALRTPFIDEWRGRPADAADQAERLRDEIVAALRQGRLAEVAPFTGQTAGLIRDVLPAGEIVRRLVAEAATALGHAAKLVA